MWARRGIVKEPYYNIMIGKTRFPPKWHEAKPQLSVALEYTSNLLGCLFFQLTAISRWSACFFNSKSGKNPKPNQNQNQNQNQNHQGNSPPWYSLGAQVPSLMPFSTFQNLLIFILYVMFKVFSCFSRKNRAMYTSTPSC